MKFEIVSNEHSGRLILIYAGWAMDATPFRHLRRAGYDIAVVWDYRSYDLDWSFARHYMEVCVVAWSLGVYAASVTMAALGSKLSKRIAINGTLQPVDSLRGIPPRIFEGTAVGLNERNLQKFYRRTCGSGTKYKDFCANMPGRDIAELAEELQCFVDGNFFFVPNEKMWDLAIISTDDAIFPKVNQWRAWQDVPVQMIAGPHLPDFQAILNHHIIDKEMVEVRFTRGLKSYESEAAVQYDAVGRLISHAKRHGICERISLPGSRTLEIGSGTGTLSRELDLLAGDRSYIEMWDMAGEVPLEGVLRCFRNVDAEVELACVPGASFDVIASASTVQWFNSPMRFLRECGRVLAPGGYLLVTTFVRGNLYEIAEATGRSLPLLTKSDWLKLIPEVFDIQVAETYEKECVFDSAVATFRHLRLTGVDSLGRGGADFNATAAVRRLRARLDSKYRLTYKPLIMVLKKKS